MDCKDAIVIPPSNGLYRGWNGSEWIYGIKPDDKFEVIEQFLPGLGWGE